MNEIKIKEMDGSLYKIKSEVIKLNFISETLTYKTEYFDYDFNGGFRIKFNVCDKVYRVLILDKHTREIIVDTNILAEENVIYRTSKKYYIEYEIRVFRIINNTQEQYPLKVLSFDIAKKNVLILIAGDKSPAGLGDSIAWLTATYQFKLLHPDTNVFVYTAYPQLEEVINLKYSDLFTFVSHTEIKNNSYYATYMCGCFFDDTALDFCPVRYEKISLIESGCLTLGFTYDDTKRLNVSIKSENKKSPYVCISSHASALYKEWHNIPSRDKLICFIRDFLKYDVYSIDLNREHEAGPLLKSVISEYTIDNTGYMSLLERVKMISNADFFIGLSSGLSWLAWICDVPVVVISGFTSPVTEFKTPYRVINKYVCNSCWNDETIKWDMSTTNCPRKNNNCFSNDFLICSTAINFYSVFNVIKEIPCVRERLENLLGDNWDKNQFF